MTTAHRPTIVTAKGGEEQGGRRIFVPSRMTSAKDAAAHTKLKFRCACLPPPPPPPSGHCLTSILLSEPHYS